MATRPPRLKKPHTYFHVSSAGTNRWNIFLDDLDRRRFIYLLAAVCRRTGMEVHAYCLMGNHFHLVVYCPDPILSAAMRDLKSRYAKYYNRHHKGTGGVFEAPFWSKPILDDDHLLTEIRYVHRNPLDLDPKTCLASHPWSSHGIYLGLRPRPRFVETRIGLELFGPDYRSIVETPLPSDKVQNTTALRPLPPTVHSPGDCTVGDSSLAGILRLVAAAAQCELSEVTPERRNGLIGVAITVAMEVAGFTAAEVAGPFGYKSSSAVHMAGRRTRQRFDTDQALADIHRRVTAQLVRAA